MSKEIVIRYSDGFKYKIVEEYENGKYSLSELQKRYGIGGKTTISKWIRKMGKNKLLGKQVIVMDENEKSESKRLREEIKDLQKVIADQKIEVLALESLFEVASEEFGIEFKKNCLRRLPASVRKKLEAL